MRAATWVAKRFSEIKLMKLTKLGNIRNVSKPHRMIGQCPEPPNSPMRDYKHAIYELPHE